jgi:hypothetical protein
MKYPIQESRSAPSTYGLAGTTFIHLSIDGVKCTVTLKNRTDTYRTRFDVIEGKPMDKIDDAIAKSKDFVHHFENLLLAQ